MIVMNLYVAVVLECFSESSKENQAAISPNNFEEFVQKWSEYDPNAT